jgi:hypothetical protein
MPTIKNTPKNLIAVALDQVVVSLPAVKNPKTSKKP